MDRSIGAGVVRYSCRRQWRRKGGGGKGEHPLRAALYRGRHLEGQKYGILKYGRFWRIGYITLFQHRHVQKV